MHYLFQTILFLICIIRLVPSNVTPKKLLASSSDVQSLIDAYDRKDYVEVWIKLIDVKLSVDPPDVHSKEMVQLLILRRKLEKYHKYYLLVYPSRNGSNQPTKNIDLSDADVGAQLEGILQVFDFILNESSSLINDDQQKQIASLLSDETKLENVDLNSSIGQVFDIFNSIAMNVVSTSEAVENQVPVDGETKPSLGSSNNVKFSEETNEAIDNTMKQIGEIAASTTTNLVTGESKKEEDPIEELFNIFGSFVF